MSEEGLPKNPPTEERRAQPSLESIMVTGELPPDPMAFLERYIGEREVEPKDRTYRHFWQGWSEGTFHDHERLEEAKAAHGIALELQRTLLAPGNDGQRIHYSKKQQRQHERYATANDREGNERAAELQLNAAVFWESMADYFSEQES